MDSNWTLKFPRTYREATGSAFYADPDAGDRLVGWGLVVIAAFVAGMWVGGMA